jgi:hypothetical protein
MDSLSISYNMRQRLKRSCSRFSSYQKKTHNRYLYQFKGTKRSAPIIEEKLKPDPEGESDELSDMTLAVLGKHPQPSYLDNLVKSKIKRLYVQTKHNRSIQSVRRTYRQISYINRCINARDKLLVLEESIIKCLRRYAVPVVTSAVVKQQSVKVRTCLRCQNEYCGWPHHIQCPKRT